MPTSYTGVASAIMDRTAPTITEPAGGDAPNAASVNTPLGQLADALASLKAHGALLDVANTLTQTQTFSAADSIPALSINPPTTRRALTDIDFGPVGGGIYVTPNGLEIAINAQFSLTDSLWHSQDTSKESRLYLFDGANLKMKVLSDGSPTWTDANWQWVSNTWTAPTLLNSFTNFAETDSPPAGYRKDAAGMVHLRGAISGGAVSTSLPIFTLPAGCRPAKYRDAAVMLNSLDGNAWVKVHPDGNVFLWAVQGGSYVGGSMHFSLDGVSFLAEQ